MMTNKKLNKTEAKRLAKQLLEQKKHGWHLCSASERKKILKYAEHYTDFLSLVKTEREAVNFIEKEAISRRFTPAGKGSDKIIWTFRGKSAALAVRGKQPIASGVRIIASHIDAPRLDLKLHPLYEDMEMAFLKTHYYGGIKKFHWLCRPLALHGILFTEDGKGINIVIGEDDNGPVLTINDLLPHLAGRVQGEKKMREAIPAEKLNVLAGGIPVNGPDDVKESVKLAILRILNHKYGITENDFVSAEIEIVPAGRARNVGIDSAFVGGYGQDDRSCAYASMKALFETHSPEHTCIALFLDKEEIGSDGNTGAKSRFIEKIMCDLMADEGNESSPRKLIDAFMNSKAISADVTAAMDPDYMEVHEKNNNERAGYGISLTKYTGSRGKYSANDASAEYLGWIRQKWNEAGIIWQAGVMGRVDEGGGGTVAKHLASHGMEVVDAGTPILSMHSPFEVAHKLDLYMTYRGYHAFFQG
jgi:aspartyl aminopeptidase